MSGVVVRKQGDPGVCPVCATNQPTWQVTGLHDRAVACDAHLASVLRKLGSSCVVTVYTDAPVPAFGPRSVWE